MFHRIKQFFLYFNFKITKEDTDFIHKYLSYDQIQLFKKLKVCEQKHSINVAKSVEQICEEQALKNKDQLVLASLLHDIGKIEYSLNLIDKSILVILDKIFRGKLKKYKNIKAIDIYYNHPEKGYNILKNIGINNRVLYLVKNHHNNNITEDKELNILKKIDDQN